MQKAGLEICGWILWIHAMGAGGETRLRRTVEPVAVARVPGGSIPFNVGECRVGEVLDRDRRNSPRGRKSSWGGHGPARHGPRHHPSGGRWPADIIFGHPPECKETNCAPGCPVAALEAQLADSGRFFLTLRGPKPRGREIANNPHPTKKPLLLETYLATLIRPEKGRRRLFVPFAGTGTEVIGGMYGGWCEIDGVELLPRWWEVGQERIRQACTAGESYLEELASGSSWVRRR